MSAYTPPTYNVTPFNPAYFATDSSGITEAQASALYLRKTTADTATVLETFTAGIATTTLQPTTGTGALTIYPAQTSGQLYLGVDASASTGRTAVIHLGDGNNLPLGANIHINNGTSNASHTNIMNGATTSGTCNIMTGNTSTGTVNICTGTGSSIVNIGSGSTTGTVTIGNSANTTTLNSGTTNIGSLKMSGDQLNALTQASGPIYIGGKQTSGPIYIGNGDQTRNGSASINFGSGTCPINIMNTGGLGGSVNIANGTGASQTTTVNIGSGDTTGTVTLGNPSNTTTIASGTTNVNTGVGTSLVPLTGTVNIATGTGATFVSTSVNIGTGATTGNILIGNTSNATVIKSSSTSIGTDALINAIYIANGNDTSNDVRIVDGTGINTSTVKICSGTTSGTLTLGNTNNTVQVNGTLSMGTGKGITLSPSSGYVAPTSSQLGYTIFSGLTTNITSTTTPLLSFNLPIGTWICSYAVRIAASTGTAVVNNINCYMFITTATSSTPKEFGYSSPSYIAQTITTLGNQNLSCVGTATIVNTVSQTLSLLPTTTVVSGTVIYVGASFPQTYLMATRIA